MGIPTCENCGRPAKYTVRLDSGYDTDTCGRCVPASAAEWRELDAPPPKDEPLTVEQAAERAGKHIRTVYRWLDAGTLGDGAWKDGSGHWRIDPEALDSRKRRKAEPQRPQRRRKAAPKKTTAGDDMGWI